MPNITWSDITREERFFTSILFRDITNDPRPLWSTMRGSLGCSTYISVTDQAYEVCFFRDAFHAGLIQERQRALEKQTFDLILSLSNNGLVIIECKAQQGFHARQMKMLHNARKIMLQLSNPKYHLNQVYLVALCSSKYQPSSTTLDYFDAIIRWNAIADVYPSNEKVYRRADDIYGE